MMPALQGRISMTDSLRGIFAAAGLGLALLAPMHVGAQRTYEPREVYLLPVYCKYTQEFRDRVPGGRNRAEIERWTSLMGATFNHMHHYCLGLMASNRAVFLSQSREDRTHNLHNSILEFDYVIKRSPPEFSLLPEIHTKKGDSLIRLDRGGEAMLELQQAVGIKADYWQAYAAMGDYYGKIGQRAKAREWLERGLSVAPKRKELVRRLAELDGAKGKAKTAIGPTEKQAPAAPR